MSDTERTIKIAVNTTADTAGFDKVATSQKNLTASIDQASGAWEKEAASQAKAEQATKTLSQAQEHLLSLLETGIGIDLGGKIVESIQEIPAMLEEATRRGVEFSAEMEHTRLSIAGMLTQFDPSIKSFQAGLAESGQVLDSLRSKANAFGLDFRAVTEGYKTTAGTMAAAGITDIQKQIDLTVTLQQAMAGLGVDGFMATRDTQDLLTGMADRTKAGRELGIKDSDIKKATEQGKLYDFLKEKLDGYAQAGAAGMNTLTAETNRFKNTLDQLFADMSKPTFDALKTGLQALNAEIQKPEVIQGLRQIGIEIGGLVKDGLGLVQWALHNTDALLAFGHAFEVVGVSAAAFTVATIISQLTAATASWISSTGAIVAETAALEANTAAVSENAAASIARAAGKGVGFASAAGGAANSAEIFAARGAMAGGAEVSVASIASMAAAAVALLAGGAAIGSWVNGVIKQHDAAAKTGTDYFGAEGGDNRMGLLQQKIFDANSGNRDDLSANINREISKTQATLDTDQDEGHLAAARARLKILEGFPALLEQQVRLNDEALQSSEAQTAEDEKQASLKEQQRIDAKNGKAWTNANDQLGDAYNKVALEETGNKLAALQNELEGLRSQFSELASKSVPYDIDKNAGPDELLSAAGSAVNPKSEEELAGLAVQIATAEKEITAEKQRQDVENARLAKQDADAITAADQKQQRTENARQAIALEIELAQAAANGETAKVKQLEAEKTLREKINQLIAAGLSPDEATKEANILALLIQQKNVREQMEQMQAADDKMGVDNASSPSAKKQAELKQHHDQTANELQAQGYTGDDYARRLQQSDNAFRRQNKVYGGPATQSPQDGISGLDKGPSAGFSSLGKGGPSGPSMDSPSGYAAGDGMAGLGTNPSASFQKLAPLGPSITAPSSNFGGASPSGAHDDIPSSGGSGAGDSGLSSAASAQASAANKVDGAASKLEAAGSSLSAAAEQASNAANTMAAAANVLESAMASIAELEGRVSALEDDAS